MKPTTINKNIPLAISADGLTRRFGDHVAVDSIDLAVPSGEIYGFLGPNGAGKSTTIRMLVTLLSPSAGWARIMGYDIMNEVAAARLRIGVALQDVALDDQQTGLEFLRLQGKLYGLNRQQLSRRIDELRELIELGDAMDNRIKTYSGGMKRRLDLAAALIHQPEVLFLDEPTTGLDPISRSKVWEEIRGLNTDLGITIFLTTQYLEEADQLAHRIGIISNGKIVGEGSPADLKKTIGKELVVIRTNNRAEGLRDRLMSIEGVSQVEFHDNEIAVAGVDGARMIGPIALELHQNGVTVEELVLRKPTLDDVFLEMTGNRLRTELPPNEEIH